MNFDGRGTDSRRRIFALDDFHKMLRHPISYDQQTAQLQVGEELSDFEVVEATWMLVDQSYRDTWAAYARDLSRDRVVQFMAERSIAATNRENVEAEIGLTSAERFRHMQSAFYSLWCKQFGDQPVELFETEWKNPRWRSEASVRVGESSRA